MPLTRAQGFELTQVDDSVQALMNSASFTGDPRKLISQSTSELLSDMYGGPPVPADLPIDLDMAASFRGAKIKATPGGIAGSVRYQQDRYLIEVTSDTSVGRQRFTTAHEVMHIQFMEATSTSTRTDGAVGRFDWSSQEEFLCDQGAAQLLMPESAVRPLISKQPTMNDVVAIAARCETSIEATMRRVVDLSGIRGCAVVLEPKLKPTEVKKLKHSQANPGLFPELEPAPPVQKLRVKYGVDHGIRVHKDKSVDDSSPLATVGPDNPVDFVGHTGLVSQRLAVSARDMPYRLRDRQVDRVLVLLFDAEQWTNAA